MDEKNNLLIENLKKYFKEENLDDKELLIELKKYFEEENLDVKENLTECKKQENIYSNNKKISKKNSVIDKFKILKQKQAVFKFNDIKDVENSLSLIKDVENISLYLKKSTDENAKIYLKLIERYERNIDKKLKITKMDRVISLKKMSMDSMIFENGENLSKGEKQKLIISRVLLRNSNILILDEALNGMENPLKRVNSL